MPSPNDPRIPEVTLGVRLYMARRLAGLSQGDVAEATGYSRNTVGLYESDASVPNRAFLIAVSSICDVSLEWLQGEAHQKVLAGGANRHRGQQKPRSRWFADSKGDVAQLVSHDVKRSA